MKTKLLLSIITLGISLSSFAQVKIGTNPTVIEPASNLEVEATTNGHKVKVDKTTGQVTIADGTQGSGKVFTSDAAGAGSWQNRDTNCGSFSANRPGVQTVPISDNNSYPYTTLIPTNEAYDPLNAFNTTTGQYVIPSTGFYAFRVSASDGVTGITDATRNSTLRILSSQKGTLAQVVAQREIYGDGTYNSLTVMDYLTVGDIISFQISVVHASGPYKPNFGNIDVTDIKFSGSRIDCNKN